MGLFSCKECVDVLRAFVDGDMTPEDEAHFKAHLGDCPPCVDFLEQYKAMPGMCKRALAAKMPEELSHKLKAFLRDKTKPA